MSYDHESWKILEMSRKVRDAPDAMVDVDVKGLPVEVLRRGSGG
jgi:hypothetical protein